jgi:phosphoglycerate dehydrogenase-like enzyme
VFEVEELRGKTLGLVGCGNIGRRVAQLGHAYGMRVVAMRSHPELSQPDVDNGLLVRPVPGVLLCILPGCCTWTCRAACTST